MNALPARYYGDPALVADEVRRLRAEAKRAAERERLHKARRIRALVREVMRKGGGNERR